jgi:hypothetical protein
MAAIGNAYTLPGYFNGLGEANSSNNYTTLAMESGLRMVPALGSAYAALTSSVLLSNVGSGTAALASLAESLNYANSVLNSLIASSKNNGRNNSSQSGGSGGGGGGGSSSGSGSSGSNGSSGGFVPSTSGSAGSLFVCHAAGGC